MISVDRAKTIISCYGGYPSAWPEQERQDVLQLLPDSKSLTDLQKEALALDRFMNFSDHIEKNSMNQDLDEQCAEKIMARLPEQMREIEQVPVTFIENRRRQSRKIAAPIALIASMALVVIGLSNSTHLNTIKDETGQLSLSDYMTLYVDDFTAFEQEFIDDEQLEVLAFLEPQILDNYN